jgi:hypothetical protein
LFDADQLIRMQAPILSVSVKRSQFTQKATAFRPADWTRWMRAAPCRRRRMVWQLSKML